MARAAGLGPFDDAELPPSPRGAPAALFGEPLLEDITRDAVATWEKRERAAGYAESSIRSWRALLHLVLVDAVEDNLVLTNVAAKRKGRGKRTARAGHRGAERTITTALGVLLIAERAALLSGRDDEFVAVVTLGFTGMRWGELVGLSRRTCDRVRSGSSGSCTSWMPAPSCVARPRTSLVARW